MSKVKKKNIKDSIKIVGYKIEITQIIEREISSRHSEYVGDGKGDGGGNYAYSEWVEDVEEDTIQVLSQTVEELSIAEVVKAINGFK